MRTLASIQTIQALEPIPGADSIERARVLGWWLVVKKGEFSAGDRVRSIRTVRRRWWITPR